VNAAQAELTLCLASTGEVRDAARARIGQLLGAVDRGAYAQLLTDRLLLPALGARAVALAPTALDGAWRAQVDDAVRQTRLRALVLDAALRRVVQTLESAGIPVLPLKGAVLGDRLYGDPGLRPAEDVDVLVPRAQLGAAVDVLRAHGYAAPRDPIWSDGLPEMHYTFVDPGALPVRIELHWRVHWAEHGFSGEVLSAARAAPDGLRRAFPAHELALLLLILARDSLYGPRLLTDIATWWDRLGAELAPGALDAIVARHPSLRRALIAAALCAERFAGVPAHGLLTDTTADRSTRAALLLADPFHADERADVEGTVMLVDALLALGREKLGFVQRYYVQPAPYVRTTYHLADAPGAIVAGRNFLRAGSTIVKKTPRMLRAAIGSRRRAADAWCPRPARG
jgi:hypothetical protein